MTTEHHTQRIDFEEHGYLKATRDDTDETQDLRLKAFMPDGSLVREHRILYNIQYDYYRSQAWKAGELTGDYLGSFEGYGHLLYEYSWQPPAGWAERNPFPDNYEPVIPEGCYMFHHHGYEFDVFLLENEVIATMNCYIRKDLDDWKKPAEINLITRAHVAGQREAEFLEERACSERKWTPFNTERGRKKKLKFLDKYGKVIGVTIPYDPRFFD